MTSNDDAKQRQAKMNEVWRRIESKNVSHSGDIVNDLMAGGRASSRKSVRKWVVAVVAISCVAVLAIGIVIYLLVAGYNGESADSSDDLQLSDEQLKINDEFISRAKEVAATAYATKDPSERRSLYATELQLYQAAGDAEAAQAVVDKILTEYPDDFTSYSIAGDFYSSSLGGGDEARAVGYYNKVLEILRQQELTDEVTAKINYYQGRINELAN